MSTCLVSTTPEDFIVPYQLYGSNPAISIFVSGHTVARLYCGSPEIWCHPIKIAVYATFGAVLRTNGARCSCIRFHAAMSPSPSGSWWNATHTGPPTCDNRVARSLAHASPLPAAMSDHEYGSLKLTHGIRCAATSAFATATAEATCVGQKYVRRTPNGRPSSFSHVVGSVFDLCAAPSSGPQTEDGMPRSEKVQVGVGVGGGGAGAVVAPALVIVSVTSSTLSVSPTRWPVPWTWTASARPVVWIEALRLTLCQPVSGVTKSTLCSTAVCPAAASRTSSSTCWPTREVRTEALAAYAEPATLEATGRGLVV